MMLSLPERGRARAATAVLACVAAATLSAATATGAQATCYSSTPSGTAFADSAADGSLAPEITTVSARLDGACAASVDPGLTGTLIDGDGVFVYLDLDGNPATGSAIFQGADAAVGSIGLTGPDPAPVVGRFDAAINTFTFAGGQTVSPAGPGGFSATLDQLGVTASPTTLSVRVATIWSGIYYDYFDFAPEPGQAPFPFSLAFSTTPPPPPPPVPTTPVPTPTTTAVPAAPVTSASTTTGSTAPSATTLKSCKIPALKRLRLAVARRALRHAGCHSGGATERVYSAAVKAGRVIRSLPQAGTTWAEPVDLVVSKGPRPKRRRAKRASSADYRTALEIAARRADAAALGAAG